MKNATSYRTYVLDTNNDYKAEIYSLNGVVKAIVSLEALSNEVKATLKRLAGSKYHTKEGRNTIVRAIIEQAEKAGTLTRALTKAEKAEGLTERPKRVKFSVFWALQQLWAIEKADK
jgi:CTP-dependent riboflavin kinase